MNEKEYYRRRRERRHRNSRRHMNRRMRLVWLWGSFDWEHTEYRVFLTYPSKNEELWLENNGKGWWRHKPTPHRYFKNNLCQCSCYGCSGEKYKMKGYRKKVYQEMQEYLKNGPWSEDALDLPDNGYRQDPLDDPFMLVFGVPWEEVMDMS